MKIQKKELQLFCDYVWQFYRLHGRAFDWRNVENPYYVLVSEIMLQQTQTYRVAPKFQEFIQAFPDFYSLAEATLHDVLTAWQGLGYNRRGKYLHETAHMVMQQWNGILPEDPVELEQLPGIGKATAASIVAFAFNKPTVFIETNIRSVFIHHFFGNKREVHDKEIMPLIAATVDAHNPREWYYGLMDYGVMLKKSLPNPSRKSAHHTKQSSFEGSDRQIRGMIIKHLTAVRHSTLEALCAVVPRDSVRIESVLKKMVAERMVQQKNLFYSI